MNRRSVITVVDEPEPLLVISLVKRRTIGTMAGNIIAAMPAVQLIVNNEISNGL